MTEADNRGLARRVAARIDIRDVRLSSTNAELSRIPEAGMLAYSFDQTVQVGWEQGQAVFTLNCGHSVNITEAIVHEEEDLDAPSETEHDVASIKFVLAGLFEISMREGDSPPSEEEISAYCSSSGVFALYPFAREYLADTTRRLGLPPLTLPVKLVPVSEHEPIE